MTTVILVDAAEEQLNEIVEWWRTHREASPTLVMDEFERCVSLLEFSPDSARTNRTVMHQTARTGRMMPLAM